VSRARTSVICPRDPVGLSLEEAAAFLSISATLFLRLVEDGRMPRPRRADGRRIWDADELVAAFRRLPRDLPAGTSPSQDDDADPWGTVRA
jgi:predicted DNA-binding transcriptional regulator AlpA